jgi:hypothetical protein
MKTAMIREGVCMATGIFAVTDGLGLLRLTLLHNLDQLDWHRCD